MPIRVGDLIGGIIGAGAGEVTMHQNVSVAQAILGSCLDWPAARNKLVTCGLNFTTNLYQFHGMESSGAQVVTVPSDDGIGVPLKRLLEAIDERTRLVAVSHILFRSSFVQDLAAITARAHSVGALIVADLYQSAGSLSGQCAGTRSRFRHGRVGEVALRRAGRGVSLRPARSLAADEAETDRLGGA